MIRSMSYSRYLSTATATATGTVRTAIIIAPSMTRPAIPALSGSISDTIVDDTSVSATRHPEYASHLICSRSTDGPRRLRENSDHAARTTQPSNPTSPEPIAGNGTQAGETPKGFRTTGRLATVPRVRASPATSMTAKPAASQLTSRQPGPGNRPSGNSRNRYTVISATNGTQIHSCTQPTYSPAGRPRWPTMAASAYSKVANSTAATSPAAAKIQPTRWPGRRQVSRAPTLPKPTAHRPLNPRTPNEPFGTGVDQSQTSSARPAAATTSVAAHSNHADLRTQRRSGFRRADRAVPMAVTVRPDRSGNVTAQRSSPRYRDRLCSTWARSSRDR